MAKSKAALETELRNDVLAVIRKALGEHYDTDVMDASTSELTLPLVDSENNEKYALVHVSIPRGTRVNGTYEPYDGYAVAEEYRAEKERKENEARVKAEEKARQEAEKTRKREAKKVVKSMKKDVQEVLPTVAQEVAHTPTEEQVAAD